MNITIPVWLLWTLGIVGGLFALAAGVAILFLACLGIKFIKIFSNFNCFR
jgi:hypothetical protein